MKPVPSVPAPRRVPMWRPAALGLFHTTLALGFLASVLTGDLASISPVLLWIWVAQNGVMAWVNWHKVQRIGRGEVWEEAPCFPRRKLSPAFRWAYAACLGACLLPCVYGGRIGALRLFWV